jgi:hypothetical protein
MAYPLRFLESLYRTSVLHLRRIFVVPLGPSQILTSCKFLQLFPVCVVVSNTPDRTKILMALLYLTTATEADRPSMD